MISINKISVLVIRRSRTIFNSQRRRGHPDNINTFYAITIYNTE